MTPDPTAAYMDLTDAELDALVRGLQAHLDNVTADLMSLMESTSAHTASTMVLKYDVNVTGGKLSLAKADQLRRECLAFNMTSGDADDLEELMDADDSPEAPEWMDMAVVMLGRAGRQ